MDTHDLGTFEKSGLGLALGLDNMNQTDKRTEIVRYLDLLLEPKNWAYGYVLKSTTMMIRSKMLRPEYVSLFVIKIHTAQLVQRRKREKLPNNNMLDNNFCQNLFKHHFLVRLT